MDIKQMIKKSANKIDHERRDAKLHNLKVRLYKAIRFGGSRSYIWDQAARLFLTREGEFREDHAKDFEQFTDNVCQIVKLQEPFDNQVGYIKYFDLEFAFGKLKSD